MATTAFPQQPTGPAAAQGDGPDDARGKPAAAAATRVSRASLLLGGFGLASAVLVFAQLFETWRVSPRIMHHVSIFGQTLSYPAANVGALLILALALVGSVVIGRAVDGALRELRASRRFHRHLAGQDLPLLHGARLIADAQPRAFCAGLIRPRVYVSTSAAELLDEAALRAVVAHEEHHASRRDPLRLATGRVLARALFFLPGLGELVSRQQELAELSADESAVGAAPANRSALARAMLTFADCPPSGDSTGVDPVRVDYLLGEPLSWRFPALLCFALAATIALLAAVALLIGRVASGGVTLAVPFLSRQPCVVVLASIPAALAVTAWRRAAPSAR